MIVVRVELHSAITRKVTEIARAEICNIGLDKTGRIGDYEVRTLWGKRTSQLDKRRIRHHGEVRGHRRLDQHVWHLVAKSLAAVGYHPCP